MIETMLKRLKPNESIVNALPSIIEAFVTFYGESERENITNKFKNLVVVGYCNPDEMSEIIEKIKKSPEYNQGYETLISSYEEYVKKCDKLKNDLEKKYTRRLIQELKDLFSEQEYEELNSHLNKKPDLLFEDDEMNLLMAQIQMISGIDGIMHVNNKSKNYFGPKLSDSAYIDSFSEKSNEILLDANSSEWKKESIKKDRIRYFKNFGLNLGDDYESYMNHPQIYAIIPNKYVVDRVMQTRKQMYTEMMNEYYNSLPEVQANRARIDGNNLLNKNDGYNASIHEIGRCCIIPNLKQVEDSVVPFPIMCLPISSNKDDIDLAFIHELNHTFELYLKNIANKTGEFLCGWDIIEVELENESEEVVSLEKNKVIRSYELFNEIINELIAQEITKIFYESSQGLFNTKESATIDDGSSYQDSILIVKEFYETYKYEIIESRKNGNINIIYEAVGKENFENLNRLVVMLKNELPNLGRVIRDMKNGIENEKTLKYKEIMKAKEEILFLMHENYVNKGIKK